jgi:ribose/xylose/arabinose/galactoside ABC-type transport system permease subunit
MCLFDTSDPTRGDARDKTVADKDRDEVVSKGIDGSVAPRRTVGWIWTMLGPFVGLLLITALFAVLTRDSGAFLSVLNWRTILVQTVVVGTAALGMTAIIVSGGIDLSVGSCVALVTVVMAVLVRDLHWPLLLALFAGVIAGGLCGLANGALITGLRVVPFIITLGSLKIFRGLAKWLSGNTAAYIPDNAKPWWFDRILAAEPTPEWILLPPGVWMLLALSLFVALGLRYSLLGRYIYAVGSNEAAARLCGVNVPGVKLAVYGLGGLATGLAGVMQFAYTYATGDPTAVDGLELEVIAAVVIGGGSLAGGEGAVLGTLIGCLIMSVLKNGCVLAGISNASQDVIIGAIIIAAVALDRFRRSREAA